MSNYISIQLEEKEPQTLWRRSLKFHIDKATAIILPVYFFFLQKFVFFGFHEKMEQVPRLVQWLISIGASIETIGPYPLHALMRLCIQASEFSPDGAPSTLSSSLDLRDCA